MIDQDAILDRFTRYVRHASESGHEAGFAGMIAAELEASGCVRIRYDDAAARTGGDSGNLHAVLEGAPGLKPILFASHLDTVSPGTGIEPVITDGVIRSSGTTVLGADDKSGVAAIMEALAVAARLAPGKRRTVELLFTVSEEAGLLGSAYASLGGCASTSAVVFDSSEPFGAIVNEGPWASRLSVELAGKAAHAAIRPEEGIHALRIGAELVSTLQLGRLSPDLTVNVANFLSPGQGNIVPDKASFEVEVRAFSEDMLQQHCAGISTSMAAQAQAAGARISIERRDLLPGFIVPANSGLIGELEEALRSTASIPRLVRTFGGSDAANLNRAGIRAVNISTGMKKSHGLDEYLAVADLVRCAGVALHLIIHGGKS